MWRAHSFVQMCKGFVDLDPLPIAHTPLPVKLRANGSQVMIVILGEYFCKVEV